MRNDSILGIALTDKPNLRSIYLDLTMLVNYGSNAIKYTSLEAALNG